MTAMNTTPSTVTQSLLSARESAPTIRKVYCAATWARFASTMIPAMVSTQPPNQPDFGEQHRDEAEHHRHGGQRAVLDHDITQRGRQRVGRCHGGEADHQRAEKR